MKNKSGFLQISFAWLFALIVGAVILFLAIYASTKIAHTQQTALDAKTAKEIGVLLDPLETGFETGKTTSMQLATDTRIYNRCNNNGNFGEQIIKVSQKSFNKWSDTGVDVSFSNKYILSDNYVEGKNFFIFSKPFDFPFKTSDVIYLTSSNTNYCFINSPKDIETEISNLNEANLFTENCPADSVNVCFESSSNCDIIVNKDLGYVEKDNQKIYFYSDALMYGAIFSSKDVYDCQVKRLMQRGEELSSLYQNKADILAKEGCKSDLNQDLLELQNRQNTFSSPKDFDLSLSNLLKNIQAKNEIAECRLW